MWKHFVKRGRSQMIIRGMGIACWIPRATNTPSGSGYVTLIAFALQQCFHEGASMLHYTLFVKYPFLSCPVLGPFATITSVISVCLSLFRMKQFHSHSREFHQVVRHLKLLRTYEYVENFKFYYNLVELRVRPVYIYNNI